MLVLADDLAAIPDRVQTLLDQEQPVIGKQFSFQLDKHHITCWILPPDFAYPSIMRRLLRSIALVLVIYTPQGISGIESWHAEFQPQGQMISLIDDPLLLEQMNQFLGTITTAAGLENMLIQSCNQLAADTENSSGYHGVC